MSVTIVVPAYNEQDSIRQTISEIKKVMDATDYKYELIIVEDCSKDNTPKILKTIKGIKVVWHAVNRGYGASLKDGIIAAKYETIVITDSDGTYPVDSIPKLLKYKDHDLVSGMRVGKNVKITFLRRIAKSILNRVAHFLVGVKLPDLNCGLRVMKKSNVMKYFSILPQRFSFTMTHLLSCVADGHSIKFVKIKYFSRAGSSSIHPIKDFIRFNIIIFRSGLLINPIKFYSAVSGFFVGLAAFVFFYSKYVLGEVMDITMVILLSTAVQIFLFGLIADMISKVHKRIV